MNPSPVVDRLVDVYVAEYVHLHSHVDYDLLEAGVILLEHLIQ